MKEENYVIGIDYGTDSVRTLIVNASNGEEVSGSVCNYTRWKEGKYCDPLNNQFRQHPLDYLEGLEKTVKDAIAGAGAGAVEKIRGISIDTTGSTPAAVNREGRLLSLTEGFEENPNAMFILWKDHTGVKEAKEINDLAHSGKFEDFTKY